MFCCDKTPIGDGNRLYSSSTSYQLAFLNPDRGRPKGLVWLLSESSGFYMLLNSELC